MPLPMLGMRRFVPTEADAIVFTDAIPSIRDARPSFATVHLFNP